MTKTISYSFNVQPNSKCFALICGFFHRLIVVYLSIVMLKYHLFNFSFIVMYYILPETEQRSLEDIELHYSDNMKGITDVNICKQSKVVE